MMSTLAPRPVHASPPFLLLIDVYDGRIAVHGELDSDQVYRLVDAAGMLTESPAACWSIDVSAVTFCDVAGLRGLFEVQQEAARNGRRLRITGPRPWLRHLLDVVGDVTGRREPTHTSPRATA